MSQRRNQPDRAAEQDRRAREAAALRANLLRRKAQQRARAATEPTAGSAPEAPPDAE